MLPRRILLAVSLAVVAGCGPHRHAGGASASDTTAAEDDALVADTEDTSNSSSHATTFGKLFLLGLGAQTGSGSDPLAAAHLVQLATKDGVVGFSPLGCAKGAPQGDAALRITFDDCTGPLGLEHVNGSLDGQFVRDPSGALVVQIANVDLVFGGRAVLAYSATAELAPSTSDPTVRDFSWNVHWEAPSRRGLLVAHTASLNMKIDAASTGPLGGHCTVIDGTTNGSVGGRGLDTVIERLASCPGKCPVAGTITSTGQVSHRTLTFVFDGSDVAKVTKPDGETIDVALVCMPN